MKSAPDPLQEPTNTTSSIPLSEQVMEAAAGSTEGRRLADLEDRLQADSELVLRLSLAGYRGPDWDLVAERLAAYGYRVMTAWVLDGTIAQRCLEKGWSGPWDSRCRVAEVAQDLATDTVVVALEKFRDRVLIPGRWTPSGGASLGTYFIGQCLLRWANVYRSWRRAQMNQHPLPPPGWESEPQAPDSTARLLDRLHLDELAATDPFAVRVLRYRDAGYGWEEIEVLSGRPIGALRGVVRRFRDSTNKRSDREAS